VLAGFVRWPYWHMVLSALAASGLVIAADAWITHERAPSARSPTWELRQPGYGPASYTAAIAALDTQIATGRGWARSEPANWLRLEGLSRALLARFRLTGNYDELAEAAAVMRQARATPPDPAGPILSDAELGMATHRLGETEAALATLARWAIPPERDERAEAAALAGDVRFYRGDISAARRVYAQAARIGDGGVAFRSAVLAKAQGDYDDAIANFRAHLDALRFPSPQQTANVALQIGAIELARGNAAEARRRFREADRIFPGYWLTKAHLAQAQALAGNSAAAIAAMLKIAETSHSAETMDALAMLLRAYGRPAESRQWAERAGKIWERCIALMPEAAYGHAIEHELVFGSPTRALDLAQRNLALRPFGESRLLLANALLLDGRNTEALEQLRLAEASGWRSAPLYALLAEVRALAGNQVGAEQARKAAQALNPHIFEPQTALVWFSHG
jgi:tetratricopeptide (TPR) repeat protein